MFEVVTNAEKVIVAQVIKNLPEFYGTRRFVIVGTRATWTYRGPTEPSPQIHTLFFKIRFNVVIAQSV